MSQEQNSGDPAPVPNGVDDPVLNVEIETPEAPSAAAVAEEPLHEKFKTILIGKPRDLADRTILQHISLIAFLAWVGLGADGLSSSCYGPSEAFKELGQHTYLAVFLALATIVTVLVISACYTHLIEEFPSGGGGYLVASKQLGPYAGVVSGCALLIDYVLTITVSIAAAGDALTGLVVQWLSIPPEGVAGLGTWKLVAEVGFILLLLVLNLRGIKESIMVLMPIFLVFIGTHVLLIGGTFVLHFFEIDNVARDVTTSLREGLANPNLGLVGMLSLFFYAYSLGAGTYTGIEAVSNSMQVMREPRVATAKRTMWYMAISLSLTAGGLILGYLVLNIVPTAGVTMNQLLTREFVESTIGLNWFGLGFIVVTVLSEAALLVIAAQAGFIGGPRMLANMAQDSWVPHWFGSLSERLATHNGITLMAFAALGLLLYTAGNVSALLVMYSINVFLTFTLSMIGMCRHWWRRRGLDEVWKRRLALFVLGAVLCATILVITVVEKFTGAWPTILVTGVCVALCVMTQRHYRRVVARLKRLDESLGQIVTHGDPVTAPTDPTLPTAAILVGGYSGLGVHTLLNALRFVPHHFKNVVYLSVGVVDSGNFKGGDAVDRLKEHTESALARYVDLARRLGLPAESFMAIGTDPVDELEQLCQEIARRYPKVIFFAGQLMFRRDAWHQRLMHNQTAYSLQRRLQWDGLPMVILPTRVK